MILLDDIVNVLVRPLFNFNKKSTLEYKFSHINSSKGLFVFIPPWRARFFYYLLIKREIKKRGYSLLGYKIPFSLLSSDYESTLQQFNEVKHSIKKDINDLKKKHGFTEINVIGTSIGCVEALMVANDNPFINKITLIVPGNCLAESMWKGIRTRKFRKSFEKQGIRLGFLKKKWLTLAPENNLNGLENKEVCVYLSKADKVIPYELGIKLINSMHNKGIVPRIIENNRLGHYGTVLSYYLFPVLP